MENKTPSITFDYLVTTVKKTDEEIRSILDGMNLTGSIIVGNQLDTADYETAIQTKRYVARIIHMKSKGVSLNRNNLMRYSTADYISFFDDDMVFYDGAQRETEDFVCSHQEYPAIRFNVTSDNKERPIRLLHKEGFVKFRNITAFGVCGGYYKRELLQRKNMLFRENIGPGTDINHGEDTVFNYDFLKAGGKIYQHDTCPIHIRQEESTWQGAERNLKVEMISHGYNYYFFYGAFSNLFARLFIMTHKYCYPEGTDYKQLLCWMKEGIKKSKKDNRKGSR